MSRRPRSSTLFPSPPLFRSATNSAKSQSIPGAASTCHRCDRLGAAEASATGFEVLPDAVPGRVVGGAELEQPVGDVEPRRSEEHTSELQSPCNLVCRLLLEK